MNDLIGHFDREADSYPVSFGTDFIQARKWALIEAHAPVQGLAADIGAASGRHALELAVRRVTVVAVDPSAAMLERLRHQGQARGLENTPVPCVAALPELPFTDASFNLIYCFSTLLLLTPAQQERAITEMARALRPGGILIVDVAGARSLAIRYWRRHYRRLGFAGVFGQRAHDTQRMITDNGLRIVSSEAHGVLSQVLLFPGLEKVPGLVRLVRGTETRPGWDARVSKRLPGLAERWFMVSQKPEPGAG